MKKSMLFILLALSLVLFSCSPQKTNLPDSDTGSQCNENSDCVLPNEYAIQSNCPFDAVCIDSKCSVVCPIPNKDAKSENPWLTQCNEDSDCDCSGRGDRSIGCKCHGKKCVSVESS